MPARIWSQDPQEFFSTHFGSMGDTLKLLWIPFAVFFFAVLMRIVILDTIDTKPRTLNPQPTVTTPDGCEYFQYKQMLVHKGSCKACDKRLRDAIKSSSH